MNFLKWLFRSKKPVIDQSFIIYGDRNENGFCDIYVNGEKTNLRMLVWTEEEIEKIHKIAEEIHKKKNNK